LLPPLSGVIATLSVFNAQEFIAENRRQIADFRSRGRWLKLAGNGSFIIAASIVITALIQALLRGLNSCGAHRQALQIWNFFGEYAGAIWRFVLALPLPKTIPRGNEDLLPWGVTLGFYLGIALFCVGLKSRAQRLRATADEAEKTLNL
jgi:hypothetical protein